MYDVDDLKHIDNFKKQEIIGEIDCQLAEIVTAGQEYRRTLRLRGIHSLYIASSAPFGHTGKINQSIKLCTL